jgi:prepilin-type N-terminal cleavage/methylation domain-containing protein
MKRSQHGFTIVELLIALVVIAALSVIAYLSVTNISILARNNAREQDAKAWASAFDTYKARFKVWPIMPTSVAAPKTVCLGVHANNKCGQDDSSTATAFVAASGADYTALNTAVGRTGSTPLTQKTGTPINNAISGPIVYVWRDSDAGTIDVHARFIFFSETNCPQGSTNINASLPSSLALVRTSMPSGTSATACAIQRDMSYTPA